MRLRVTDLSRILGAQEITPQDIFSTYRIIDRTPTPIMEMGRYIQGFVLQKLGIRQQEVKFVLPYKTSTRWVKIVGVIDGLKQNAIVECKYTTQPVDSPRREWWFQVLLYMYLWNRMPKWYRLLQRCKQVQQVTLALLNPWGEIVSYSYEPKAEEMEAIEVLLRDVTDVLARWTPETVPDNWTKIRDQLRGVLEARKDERALFFSYTQPTKLQEGRGAWEETPDEIRNALLHAAQLRQQAKQLEEQVKSRIEFVQAYMVAQEIRELVDANSKPVISLRLSKRRHLNVDLLKQLHPEVYERLLEEKDVVSCNVNWESLEKLSASVDK